MAAVLFDRFGERSADGGPLQLRPEIERSWRRCRAIGVAGEQSLIAYSDAPDTDTKLVRAAAPILDRLAEQLADTPVTILLADQGATILDRRTGPQSLLGRLDRANVAPGFTFAEQYAGTNGIGTALEERKAFRVRGDEHLLDSLRTLACAGSPIIDPASRAVVGILDITCKLDDANDLMGPLLASAVSDIEARLFAQSSVSEQILLREYTRSRRRGNAAVVAMNRETVIATPAASRLMDSTDQMMIWDWITTHLTSRDEWEGPLRFAEGVDVRIRARRVGGAGDPLGAVLELRPTTPAPGRCATPTVRTRSSRPGEQLAGRSVATFRLKSQLDEIAPVVGPVLVTGEAGVGKSYVARYVQRRWGNDHAVVVDASTLSPTAVTELRSRVSNGEALIIEHLDEVPDDTAAPLRRLLDSAAEASAPLVATATSGSPDESADPLHTHIRRRVSVSPLRHRIEDLDDLARELMARHRPGRPVPQLQPAAHRALVTHHWPGNVRELDAALSAALDRSMGFDIKLEHLPNEYRGMGSGRQMTTFERVEREAIIRALDEADGNKSLAADRLGVARSTLYRKIRALGLENERFSS